MKKQSGYLLLIAAFLVVISSFTVVAVTGSVTNSGDSASSDLNTTQSLYVADSGLAKAIYPLTTSNTSQRIACSSVTGDASFTNVTLGSGQFTVTASKTVSSSATLSNAITSSSSIVPVSTLTGYAKNGRITIDSETIDYTALSSDAADCNNSEPCLLGVTRGAAGTTAAAHGSGSSVIQNRCIVTSTGAVPTLANPTGERIISQDIYETIGGWSIGDKNSGDENIIQLDGFVWSELNANSSLSNVHLNDIHMLNEAEGWIVGNKANSEGTIYYWNGISWVEVSPAGSTPNKDLNSIHCSASNDCWTVGDSKTFLKWDGSSWTNGTVDSSIPNKILNGVYCSASDDCWAVGQQQGGGSFIARWEGTTWTRYTGSSSCDDDDDDDDDDDSSSSSSNCLAFNVELTAIDCSSSSDCWAVGKNKTFVHWDGNDWSEVNPSANVPNKQLNSVTCNSSNDCWAVGSSQGGSALFVYWNGSSWSRVYPDNGVPNENLNTIHCINSNECWAGGNNGSLIYWNGATWLDSGNSTSNNAINGIHITGNSSGPYLTNWQER